MLFERAAAVRIVCRMVKKAVQRGRSKRGTEAYTFRYVEAPSAAITRQAGFFSILLGGMGVVMSIAPVGRAW